MISQQITLNEYIDENGNKPYASWLASISDKKTRARIILRVDRMCLGNFGDTKPVGDGVYELRLSFGPGYRVYYAREEKVVYLLLCGGDKSSK